MAYPQTSFSHTQLSPSSLIGRRRKAVSANTLLYQLNVLKETGRYEAFKLKWHTSYDDPPEVWPIPNHLFWDSDVAKWIEGACYFLRQQRFPEVEAAVGELVSMIASAQQADGYLNIHYTVVEPGKRFTNLRDMHELYNAGHLIEAALAHNDLYNNDMLLRPILKYVDLLCSTFGPGANQIPGYPGHPEIELGLLRLYDRTGHAKHFELAKFFITERGNPAGYEGKHYFDVEAEMRQEHPSQRPAFYPEQRCMWYHQAHAPIIEQQSVEGHSVRAMYLLTAVADLVRLTGCDQSFKLENALYRLWDNMVGKKMYVTGGIGAIKQWEGFGLDYFLPQSTDEGGCYSETCAAIGVMMLAERLLQIDLNSRFADVMELCLYNAVLTSMSPDGKRFTYVNQLASSDSDPSKREDWFTVACCPPNVLRLLGQIGGYVWKLRSDGAADSADIAVHLYVASVLKVSVAGQDVQVSQSGNWPWSENIAFCVKSPVPVTLRLRVPQWATSVELEPRCKEAKIHRGYMSLPSEWIAQNPEFTLHVPLLPRWIAQDPTTRQNTISLARGPVIYCVEDSDNEWVTDHFKSLMVDAAMPLKENHITEDTSGDSYVGLTLEGGAHLASVENDNSAPFVDKNILDAALRKTELVPLLTFIPYYARSSRGGKGQMRVGLRQLDRASS